MFPKERFVNRTQIRLFVAGVSIILFTEFIVKRLKPEPYEKASRKTN